MNQVPFVNFSNRVEILYEQLRDILFDKNQTNLFTRRIIIVPSPAMKSWLMLRMAQDPKLGFATGMRVVYLDEALEILSNELCIDEEETRIPSHLELSFAIENLIRSKLESQDNVWIPIKKYVSSGSQRKKDKRLAAFSDELARLFSKYGKYGGEALLEWNENRYPQWQIALWKELYHTNPSWSYPYKKLESNRCNPQKFDYQIHLFALSFISQLDYRFMEKISKTYPVHFWMMSPCQAFWSDLISDKEKKKLKERWKDKNANKNQLEDLEEYLRECNPLLANFGRLGRQMAMQIEESHAITNSLFELPETVENIEQYQDTFFDDVVYSSNKTPFNILQGVQADLASLRTPKPENRIPLLQNDSSIQVHSASSRLREIEVLHNNLLEIIHKHSKDSKPITPNQMIVMAPNIMDYEPYIKMVFGSEDSKLDYQIMDLPMQSQNPVAQVFVQLISLPLTRWEVSKVFALFEQPAFHLRHGLKREDLETLREWLKKTGIRWAENQDHRAEIFQRDHGLSKSNASQTGTWEEGWQRLLHAFVVEDEELKLEFGKSEMAGKIIGIFKSLRSDLSMLDERNQFTLDQWADFLRCLAESYLSSTIDKEAFDGLLNLFQRIKEASKNLRDKKFSFASVRKRLLNAMEQKDYSYRDTHLHAVKFCSMLPMRAVPAQVIVLLGMDEGAYPRREVLLSLNLLTNNPKADYSPSQTDYDRYLFLEALLSARQYFHISYCNYDPSDPKSIPPAIIVTELLNYLDQAFDLKGKKPSELNHMHHPFNSFDAQYFIKGSSIKSFSQHAYNLAQSYYGLQKLDNHKVVESFPEMTASAIPESKVITLEELSRVIFHPMRKYLSHKLDIFFEWKDNRILDDLEIFEISRKDRTSILERSLTEPIDSVLNCSTVKSKLPVNPFNDFVCSQIKTKYAEINEKLPKGPIFSVEFNIHCFGKGKLPNGDYICPPLKFELENNQIVYLVGKVPLVNSEGIICITEKDTRNDTLLKSLPSYLALQIAGFGNKIFISDLIKQKKPLNSDPYTHLQKLIEYFFQCHQELSPMDKAWLRPLVQGDLKKLNEAMQIEEGEYSFVDDNLGWAFRMKSVPSADEIMNKWHGKAVELFGAVEETWWGK